VRKGRSVRNDTGGKYIAFCRPVVVGYYAFRLAGFVNSAGDYFNHMGNSISNLRETSFCLVNHSYLSSTFNFFENFCITRKSFDFLLRVTTIEIF
jgi:hypothetical protein